jgi:hypothetical protein
MDDEKPLYWVGSALHQDAKAGHGFSQTAVEAG